MGSARRFPVWRMKQILFPCMAALLSGLLLAGCATDLPASQTPAQAVESSLRETREQHSHPPDEYGSAPGNPAAESDPCLPALRQYLAAQTRWRITGEKLLSPTHACVDIVFSEPDLKSALDAILTDNLQAKLAGSNHLQSSLCLLVAHEIQQSPTDMMSMTRTTQHRVFELRSTAGSWEIVDRNGRNCLPADD
jgi:hypothetical protein